MNPNRPDMYDRTPLVLAAIEGHEGVVKILLEQENVDPIAQMRLVMDHSGGLPSAGMRELSSYCWDAKMSTLIAQIRTAMDRSAGLPSTGTRGWSSYYWNGKMSTPIAEIRIIEPHSCVLL